MYQLFVSWNCGMSYEKECEANIIEELRPKLEELDKNMLRWYIEEDGEYYSGESCAIYKGIFQFIKKLNQ